MGGEYHELRFEHVGKSISLPSETSRRHLSGQVWKWGVRSKPKIEVWESFEMVFIATRLRSPWEAVLDGKVLGWALGLSDE